MCGWVSCAVTRISRRKRSGPSMAASSGLQDLDGDLAMVPEIVGEIDRGHSPAAQLPLNAVAVGEGGLERHYGIRKVGIQKRGASK